MDCRNVTSAKLIFLLRDELPLKEAASIEAHLKICPGCTEKHRLQEEIMSRITNGEAWAKRKDLEYRYEEAGSSTVIAQNKKDDISITEDYLENQETIGDELLKTAKRSPWWLISVAIHALLLFLLSFLIIAKPQKPLPQKIIEADLPPKQEPEYDPEEKRDILEEKKEIPETNPEIVEKSEVVPMENVEVSD